jgi:hypothetical protein
LRRVALVVVFCLLLAVPAAYLLRADPAVPGDAPTLDAMADAIGTPIMEHIYRGHVPERSGEVMLVPKPHRYLQGFWDYTTLGTANPDLRSSHPNPWAYLARVPLIFYGPGYVRKGVEVSDGVDIADLAPTYARLLRMDDFVAEGTPLTAITKPVRKKPPRVILTVVIDGGGWNALQEHPHSWPTIADLSDRGVTYVNATIGSAPSITGALHATFGAGVYPLTHGIPGNQMRGADGKNTDAWLDNADPRYLQVPTVSELWDEQNANKPVVATVSYEGWHLGMIGHGAQRPGGDKDIAVLWKTAESEWWINEEFYKLPDYLQTTDLDKLAAYEAQLDRHDGVRDGTWFGNTIEELQVETTRPGTPAFARFTGDAVVDVIRREGIGDDKITDLLWVELKPPDFGGHIWNVVAPEEADILRETDRQIARFKAELDREVGKGKYVIAISADHGQQPVADLVGGWRIGSDELERDIEDRFGPVVEKITTVDIYLDLDQIEEEDVDPSDIASYLGTYTIGDNIPEGAPGAERVPEGRLDELLFAGAFSTGYLQALTPEKITSFGDSDYPGGDFAVDASG